MNNYFMKKIFFISIIATLLFIFLPRAEYRIWLPGPFENKRNFSDNTILVNQRSNDSGIYKFYQDDYSISYYIPNNKPIEIPTIKLNNFTNNSDNI
jgi:hypothetical protein